MKHLKKLYAIVALVLIAIISITTLSYSLFIYQDNSNANIDNTFIDANSVTFSSVDSDYYRVYFFASPYYATGANLDGTSDSEYSTISTSDETDPLIIANSSNNPYNCTDNYVIANGTHTNSYEQNFQVTSSSYTYIASESLTQTSTGSATITPFKKADFSGYLINDPSSNNQKIYTYYSTIVKGHLSSSLLNNLVAQSAYKDMYGFSPEFIGWTYDISSLKSRTLASQTNRYSTTTSEISYDSNSNTITYTSSSSNTYYQIGNYGKYPSSIDIVSEKTSLKQLDNYATSTSSSLGLDGSKVNDKVIYLYPVFGAKEDNNTSSSYPNLIKLRKNPGTSYSTAQSDEINYTQNRYTRYFAYTSNSNDHSTPNYSVYNYYISSSSSETDINQIDVSFFYTGVSDTNYESTSYDNSDWKTLLKDSDIDNLNLETGYYNIDINIWWTTSSTTSSDSYYSTAYSNFTSSNLYDRTISGIFTNTGNSTYKVCYIIGFHKEVEYHLTGDSINGDINNYTSSNFKEPAVSYTNGTLNKYYYTVDNLELDSGDLFTILNQELETDTTYTSLDYSFNAMNSTLVEEYNTYLDTINTNSSSSSDLTTHYNLITDSTNLIIDSTTKAIKANSNNVYSILFAITYKSEEVESGTTTIIKGHIIESISIAFKTMTPKYKFVVLQDPSKRDFSDYDFSNKTYNHTHSYEYIYDEKYHYHRCIYCGELEESDESKYEAHTFDSNKECSVCGFKQGEHVRFNQYFNNYDIFYYYDSFICGQDFDKGTTLNWNTNVTTNSGSITLGELFLNYWNYELVDVSTHMVLDYRIFLTDDFQLNRNYVCYIRLRTDTSK